MHRSGPVIILVALLGATACASQPPDPSSGSVPSPVESADPSVQAEPAEATGQDFRLSFTTDRDRYRAGDTISAVATVVYDGPAETATIWGSGSGPIYFGLLRSDDGLTPGGGSTTDCSSDTFERHDEVVQEFIKTAAYSEGDPHAAWIEAYAADPELRLPAGSWRLSATLHGYLARDCRGAMVNLSVEVTVEVEP